MLRQKSVISQGLHINYYQSDVFDSNNSLIFLHGWGSKALNFGKILEKCENILAIDLPGFGSSENPKTTWTLSDYADFIKIFLEEISVKNPIIIGHSFGGSIGIKYGACQKNVKKLILIGSAGIRRKNLKKYAYLIIAKLAKNILFFFNLSKLRRVFYKKIGSEDYINAGALKKTYKKIINEDLRKDLKKIYIPVVIIWGENDIETPVEDGKIMQQIINNSKLYIISKAGHYVFLENEKEFEKIFLSNIK